MAVVDELVELEAGLCGFGVWLGWAYVFSTGCPQHQSVIPGLHGGETFESYITAECSSPTRWALCVGKPEFLLGSVYR